MDGKYRMGYNDISTPIMLMVSTQYGSPGRHLWIFMLVLENFPSVDVQFLCLCSHGTLQVPKFPSFVGYNYFCESGCFFIREVSFFRSSLG